MLQTITAKGFTWHHVSNLREDDLHTIAEHVPLHPLDIEDMRADTPLAKLDTYRSHVFCIFRVPYFRLDGRLEGMELFVFLNSRMMFTASRAPVPSVQAVFDRLKKSTSARGAAFSRGAGFVMYRALIAALREFPPVVTRLTRDVARLEVEVYEGKGKQTTLALGRARRDVLYIRHLADPQRHMLQQLEALKRSFLPDELNPYLDDLRDILDNAWLTVDNLKLILDGLFDTNEALLSHKTNELVSALTFMSVLLMAPALVAGIYGMNVNWLPFSHSPTFVFGALITVTTVVGSVFYLVFRRR